MREESRAAKRRAAAHLRQTCTAIAVPVPAHLGGVSQAIRAAAPSRAANAKAGKILARLAPVVIAIVALAALFALTGCAFTPEGLTSAGEALQSAAPVVNTVVPGPTGDLLELIVGGAGGLLVLAGGLWAKSRKGAAIAATVASAKRESPASAPKAPTGPIAMGAALAFTLALTSAGCATTEPRPTPEAYLPPKASARAALPLRVRHAYELWCVKTTAGKPAYLVTPVEAFAANAAATEEYIATLEEIIRERRAVVAGAY